MLITLYTAFVEASETIKINNLISKRVNLAYFVISSSAKDRNNEVNVYKLFGEGYT